ncbi:Mini-ribonuclease 3 [Sulfoacidibacillus thermotolerans]|uniref:Mini-ribonuclease 3 n=1 Tax=Sulfoacidibacillus thermotolerans TaxID=1765684 RepID=UPI001FE5C65F|nr:ribonuclease III domain-containing protein [Sulfoacidibacillus thermotolerans]
MNQQEKAYRLPPLTLAYVGDAVWELAVRHYLVENGETQPRRLHRLAVERVRAKSQADRLRQIREELSDQEREVVRRGRNAKSNSIPRSASVADYRASTGIEALLGYLYLADQKERLNEILQLLLQVEETDKQ